MFSLPHGCIGHFGKKGRPICRSVQTMMPHKYKKLCAHCKKDYFIPESNLEKNCLSCRARFANNSLPQESAFPTTA